MSKFWCIPKIVLRASIWKTTPEPCAVGLPTLLAWCIILAGIGIICEYCTAGAGARFSPYGLNSSIAGTASALAIASLFVRTELRLTFLSAVLVLGVPLMAVNVLVTVARAHPPFDVPDLLPWLRLYSGSVIFVVQLVWWIGAVCAILRSIQPEGRARLLLRAVGVWVAMLVVLAALPYYPTFRPANFDRQRVNLWEYIPAVLNGSLQDRNKPPPRQVDSEQVELAQPALLDAETSGLAPRIAGKTNVYAIGIAGWSDQDVFVKELNGGIKSLSQILPLDGHVVHLVNNLDTIHAAPIASLQNFAAAVHAVAHAMDRENDVLLLFMTSHGSPDGVALLLRGEIYADLSPRDVAAILDSEGITNRIVIVSACYSGVFLKPLANDTSIVLTAADEDHPSFGCSDKREWTYFGDAFFNRALMPGDDIEEAFADAKAMIGRWEASEGLTPSNPQAHFGRALVAKLASVYLQPNFTAPLRSAAVLERAATPVSGRRYSTRVTAPSFSATPIGRDPAESGRLAPPN